MSKHEDDFPGLNVKGRKKYKGDMHIFKSKWILKESLGINE